VFVPGSPWPQSRRACGRRPGLVDQGTPRGRRRPGQLDAPRGRQRPSHTSPSPLRRAGRGCTALAGGANQSIRPQPSRGPHVRDQRRRPVQLRPPPLLASHPEPGGRSAGPVAALAEAHGGRAAGRRCRADERDPEPPGPRHDQDHRHLHGVGRWRARRRAEPFRGEHAAEEAGR